MRGRNGVRALCRLVGACGRVWVECGAEIPRLSIGRFFSEFSALSEPSEFHAFAARLHSTRLLRSNTVHKELSCRASPLARSPAACRC